MYKTKDIKCKNKLAVNITELQGMLSVGRKTAVQIANEAGAVMRVGRRNLYNVKKIEEHLYSSSGESNK